jgi:FAD:protein FMN transferase
MRKLEKGLHKSAHEAMATVFEVIIADEDPAYARQAAAAVFREIDRLEGLLSRFIPNSEISQVNRLRPGQWTRVSIDAFDCLEAAISANRATNGAFDVTVGPLMDLIRREKSDGTKAAKEERAAAFVRTGMDRLVLDRSTFSVGVALTTDCEVGLEVDLGAIGKGYALDCAARLLEDWGIENALIHGGTSTVLAIGSGPEPMKSDSGWIVAAGAEWGQSLGVGTVAIRNEALSGSGKEVRGDHVLDPRTGEAVDNSAAAWAIAPSAALADALSTAFMVMSRPEVTACCRSLPGISGLVVERRSGLLGLLKDRVLVTPGFTEHSAARGQPRI